MLSGILNQLTINHKFMVGLFSGTTSVEAIVINGARSHRHGVQAEYRYLTEKFGRPRLDWLIVGQKLVEKRLHYFDELRIRLADGSEQVVIFDITDFFGKWEL